MAVGDAYVFPGFLTPVLTQLFFPKPPTTFLTCFCRGERRKHAGKKSRLNRGSNSQPPGHESDTLTTEPPRRVLSQETDRSKTSVKRIMHQDLHRFPYKVQILQAQTAASKAERLAFCQSTSRRIEDHPYFLDLIFFRDEAHFHLSRHVNKQNMRSGPGPTS